ncbi:hypothetical protein PCE1_002858 [Barthelona sp. PCE]
MNAPSYKTAVVLIPDQIAQNRINEIRAVHDSSKINRWMPHVTLAYPFRSEEQFDDDLYQKLQTIADSVDAFTCNHGEIGSFRRAGIVYSNPSNRGPIKAIMKAIVRTFPRYNNQKRGGRFTPHMTIGSKVDDVDMVIAEVQGQLDEVNNHYTGFHLIARGDDTPFRIVRTFYFGGNVPQE